MVGQGVEERIRRHIVALPREPSTEAAEEKSTKKSRSSSSVSRCRFRPRPLWAP